MRGPSGPVTGGAWLSSARVVRCWVKSRNERNPYPVLPAGHAGDSQETAGVNSEEGGDDVKSSCPLCPGLHTCYNGRYNGLPHREVELIPKNRSQFRLQAATRLHEDGVASNRRSAYCGEYVPGPCTHRPSHHWSLVPLKSLAEPEQGRRCPRCAQQEGWSRNKVAVPEGAAGSPPLRSLSHRRASTAPRGEVSSVRQQLPSDAAKSNPRASAGEE